MARLRAGDFDQTLVGNLGLRLNISPNRLTPSYVQ